MPEEPTNRQSAARRPTPEPLTYNQPFEWEGRMLYTQYRNRFDIRKDWVDLFEDERQEWRDDARRNAEQDKRA